MSVKSLALLLTLALGGSAMAGVIEPQPQIHIAPPLQAAPQATKPPKLTSEQEAALVEVRKILQEARQIAEGIEVPSGPFTMETIAEMRKVEAKERLLDRIEDAQLTAGDVNIKPASKGKSLFLIRLALAQARYGYIQESVQTAGAEIWSGGGLELIDVLLKAGGVAAATTFAETNLVKFKGKLDDESRHEVEAVVFALIARRQYEFADPAATQSLQRALKAARSVKWPEYRYRAMTHVARAQALLGDRAGSAESFAQAVQAANQFVKALSGYHEAMRPQALRMVAKAQAEAGDMAGSAKTFQESLGFANALPDRLERTGMVSCIAWAQIASGDRPGGLQTLQSITHFAETLSLEEQRRALREIVLWQLKVGDREGAGENIQRLKNLGADIIDLTVKAGELQKAMALAAETQQTGKQKVDYLRFIAVQLIKKKDPLGTPEVFQDLARQATALLKTSLPKEESFARRMRADVAFIQTAAGDIAEALRTLDEGSRESTGGHDDVVELLIDKGDIAGARLVVEHLKKDRQARTDGWQKLGRGYGRLGKVAEGLALARQQVNPYSVARMLLGIAEGVIEQQGIKVTIWFQGPDIPLIEHCPDIRRIMTCREALCRRDDRMLVHPSGQLNAA